MKTRYDQLEYAYAVGRLRVLETKLFGPGDYEKLLHATSREEAVRVLADCGWGTSGSYEEMIDAQTAQLFQLLDSMGGSAFLNIQRIKYDYHNIRVLLKGELAQRPAEDLLVDWGTVPLPSMKEAITTRDYRNLTPYMKQAVEAGLEQYARIPDPSLLDVTLDSYALSDMLLCAQRQPDSFIRDMVRMQVDIFNIKTFVRVRKMGKDYSYLAKALADGGTLDKEFFLKNSGEPADKLAEVFARTSYGAVFQGEESVELALDRLFAQAAERKRSEPFGLAPLAGYFWAKETEIANVRIILTCISGGIGAEDIRRRLRGV